MSNETVQTAENLRASALENALAQVERAFPRPLADPESPSSKALANRQNAQLSTGPRSAEGKRRSSANATKHGLSGSTHVTVPFESHEEYEAFRKAMAQHYAPLGPMEAILVERLTVQLWRLRRVPILEALMMDQNSGGGQTPQYAFVGNNGCARFLTMSRYEVALERSMHRTLSELERMQEARAPRTADGMLGELIRNLSSGE